MTNDIIKSDFQLNQYRNLTHEEEKDFRRWARENWEIGSKVIPIWHPIVRQECAKMLDEDAKVVMTKKYDSISHHKIDSKDLFKNNPDILRSLKAIAKLGDQKLQKPLDEAKAPDIKKGDYIIVSKSKRPYKMGGMVDPKTILPAESDKMYVHSIRKTKNGRKAHLRYDPKSMGGYAIYLDKMPDFMSVKVTQG
jgi:hypothetical protein